MFNVDERFFEGVCISLCGNILLGEKDPFAKSSSDKQIKRNRNKALSKLLALSSANLTSGERK